MIVLWHVSCVYSDAQVCAHYEQDMTFAESLLVTATSNGTQAGEADASFAPRKITCRPAMSYKPGVCSIDISFHCS